MRVKMIGLLVLISIPLPAASDFDHEQIQQRISPVGAVRIEEQSNNVTPQASKPDEPTLKKSSGQAIYERYCVVCHGTGVAGAPKFRDAADWGPRRAKQTMDSLTASALKGLNAMPVKGTCQECSDTDIKAAIQYMVPQS